MAAWQIGSEIVRIKGGGTMSSDNRKALKRGLLVPEVARCLLARIR